jgi:predicted negative regulator of RcsB-dependent stress response
VIGLAGLWGYRFWESTEAQALGQASEQFEQVLALSADKEKADEFETKANELIKSSQGKNYAILSSLLLAKSAVENKNYDEAIKQLTYALENANTLELRHIATTRLARVYTAKGDTDKALSLVAGKNVGDFQHVYDEIAGDAYMIKGEIDKAREAYKRAAKSGQSASESLSLKMYDTREPKTVALD